MPDPRARGRGTGGVADSAANAYRIGESGDGALPSRFAFLADPDALRRRFLLSQILGPPRALQLRGGSGGRRR